MTSVGVILVLMVSSVGSAALSAPSHGTDTGSSVSSSSGDVLSEVPAQLPLILQDARRLGTLNSSTQLSVQVVLPLSDPVGLSNKLTELYNPSSPHYHQFLSLEQFAQLFGPSQAELSALTDYMQTQGVHVQKGTFDSDPLVLTGTAQQMEAAFKTQMGLFEYDGQSFYSAVSLPQLPRLFSNVQMVYGLQDYDASVQNPVPLYRVLGPVNKLQTSSGIVYYSPSEIRQTYNVTALYSEGYTGSGITIAIVDAYGDPHIQPELNSFDSQFNLPATDVNVTCVDGPCDYSLGISTGWNVEIALDVEWAHAMAPGATIDLYIGSDSGQPLYDAALAAVSNPSTNILSMSWGIPENDMGSSAHVAPVYGENYPWLDQVLQEAAAVGVTSFASSGDSGASYQFSGLASPYGGALYPSTDPYVTGVGGTSLYMKTTSGSLQFPYTNATGEYGTETAWSWNNVYDWGTGGGSSTLFPRPEWQTIPGLGMRGAPDVSWDADPMTGVIVGVEGSYYIIGGTSVGSPSLAGSLATLEQKAGQKLGLINPTLYSILNSPTEYSKVFHDTTVGNNDPNSASPGWDPLTGMGSPNMGELAGFLAPTGSIEVTAGSSIGLGMSAPYATQSHSTIIGIQARAFQGEASVTGGTGFADVASSSGVLLGNVTMSYDSAEDVWLGSYTIKSTDPPGSWTATVHIVDGTLSGVGSTTFSVGDAVTLFGPYSFFQVSQTIRVSAEVDGPNGPVSDGAYTAVFTLQNATGPLEGKIPLAFDPSTEWWEGNFTVSGTADQGVWALTVNGTDSSGNRGSTYSWLNVGLEAGTIYTFNGQGEQTPSFVLGDNITVQAFPYDDFGPVSTGSFSATISSGSTVLGTLSMSFSEGAWVTNGALLLGQRDPVGFYTITVSGSDESGNSGSSSTVVRVAPYDLNVRAGTSSPSITGSGSLQIEASVSYPNGTVMKAGSVDAFLYLDGLGQVGWAPLTYDSDSGEFVALFQSQGPPAAPVGDYVVAVSAVDPTGNFGLNNASFLVTPPFILLTPSSGAVGTSVTVKGTGLAPSATVSLTSFGGSGPVHLSSTCTTNPSGNLYSTEGCTFVVPSSSVGIQTVAFSDGPNTITAAFEVTLLGVACSRSAVAVGSATTCKATVYGTGSAPTGDVNWTSSGSGGFSTSSCRLSRHTSSSTCSVKFTPMASSSSFILTANYAGDNDNPPSIGEYNLVVKMEATKTALSCTPGSTVAGSETTPVTCSANVTGYFPTGQVILSQSGTGSVAFISTGCVLITQSSTLGTCPVVLTGFTSGRVIVTADYTGDVNNLGSSRKTELIVIRAPTAVSLSCAQSSFAPGTPITCTATVTGVYTSHTGTVAFAQSKGSGTGKIKFSSTACTLSSGSCSVTVVATAAGTAGVKATYSGDSDNLKSSGTLVLTIS